ncbi:MAG: hypothetical protein RL163_2018 [Pseudomonadota bacterium]
MLAWPRASRAAWPGAWPQVCRLLCCPPSPLMRWSLWLQVWLQVWRPASWPQAWPWPKRRVERRVWPWRYWSGQGLSRASPHNPAALPRTGFDKGAVGIVHVLWNEYPRRPGTTRPRRERRADCTQTKDCSRPWTKISRGKSIPMNTILLIRASSGPHAGPKSLPMSWCTPWKITLRSVPFMLSTPL